MSRDLWGIGVPGPGERTAASWSPSQDDDGLEMLDHPSGLKAFTFPGVGGDHHWHVMTPSGAGLARGRSSTSQEAQSAALGIMENPPRPYRYKPDDLEFGLYPGESFGGGAAGVWSKGDFHGPENWLSGITWGSDGEIGHVETKPEHQRRGLATQLFDYVKQHHRPDLRHSPTLSDDGRAWSQYEQSRHAQRTAATDDYLKGNCAGWALAHQREYPHLRLGIDWEHVGKGHPEWEATMEDNHLDPDDPYEQDHVFRWPQHVFTHDDTHAYDADGAHPLDSFGEWSGLTLNHTPEDAKAIASRAGMYDRSGGQDAPPEAVRRVPPHTAHRTAMPNCSDDEYMTGQCAAWAISHQREHPHLRLGIDWQRLTPDHPDWDEEDDGDEAWQPQHIFTHDDHYAYDVRGAHPLSEIRQWDDVTLNHSPEDVMATGMYEGGYEPEPEMVRRVPPRTAHRTAMPWYHNTDAELNPGDMLLPAAERGHDSRWKNLPEYDPNLVYFTKEDSDENAEYWRGRHRYEVEPIGQIERDPEHFHHVNVFEEEHDIPWDENLDLDEYPEARGVDVMQNSYVAPRARVVRKLPPHPFWETPENRNKEARIMSAAVTVYTQDEVE